MIRSMIRPTQNLITGLLVVGIALAVAIWGLENVRWEEPACPPSVGHGLQDMRWLENDEAPATTDAERLLSRPNFGATSQAAGDLEDGIVDGRMISTLLTISEEHSICVQTFKEGHCFLPGVEDGPTIPEGYGNSGGFSKQPLLRSRHRHLLDRRRARGRQRHETRRSGRRPDARRYPTTEPPGRDHRPARLDRAVRLRKRKRLGPRPGPTRPPQRPPAPRLQRQDGNQQPAVIVVTVTP